MEGFRGGLFGATGSRECVHDGLAQRMAKSATRAF